MILLIGYVIGIDRDYMNWLSPKKAWFAQQSQPFLGGREKQNGHVFDFEARGVLWEKNVTD